MQTRPLMTTIASCCLVALITAPVHAGFMLVCILPILAIWLLYSAFVIWRQPAKRKLQAIQVGLWFLVVGGVLIVHLHYFRAARSAGNVAVAAVLQYRASHGMFPPSLQVAGVRNAGWGMFYELAQGKPVLFYPATFIAFDTYAYNFKRRAWEHQAS